MAMVAAVAAIAVVPWWALAASPAAAANSTQLSVTASGATTVGLTVFANVNLFGANHPGGNVTFRLFGPHDTACASPIFTSTVAVTGTSVNSGRWTTISAGTYRWEVSYGGDGANSPSGPTPCSQPTGAVVVGPASTSLTITATAPSGGGPLHATVALAGSQHPAGTVTFSLSPPGDTFCSKTVFTASVAVHGAGNYPSPGYPPTATGTYKWRASYSGDANNAAAPITACLTPGAAATVTSLVAPPAPPTTPARPSPSPAAANPAAATPAAATPAAATPTPAASTTAPSTPRATVARPAPGPTGTPSTSSPTGGDHPSNPKLALANATASHPGQIPWPPIVAVTAAAIAALAASLLARTAASRRTNRSM